MNQPDTWTTSGSKWIIDKTRSLDVFQNDAKTHVMLIFHNADKEHVIKLTNEAASCLCTAMIHLNVHTQKFEI